MVSGGRDDDAAVIAEALDVLDGNIICCFLRDADEEGGDVDNIHTADVEVCAKEVMAEEVTA